MNVFVILLIAGAASARHVLDAQFNNKKNSENISQNPESTPYVNCDFRQTDKAIPTKTKQRFVQTTGKYDEHIDDESMNNISNEENDYRLRTNAYTTEAYSTTEIILEDSNINTNRKEQNYIADRNLANQGVITGPVYQQGNHNSGFIKSNKPKSKEENRPPISNQDRRHENNVAIKNPQTERTSSITNYKKKTVIVLETVLVQPIPTQETREGMERLPKADTDEQIWVWGTEGTNVTSTEPGSLDDRAAFTGDRCPSGEAKVKGICVEKH